MYKYLYKTITYFTNILIIVMNVRLSLSPIPLQSLLLCIMGLIGFGQKKALSTFRQKITARLALFSDRLQVPPPPSAGDQSLQRIVVTFLAPQQLWKYNDLFITISQDVELGPTVGGMMYSLARKLILFYQKKKLCSVMRN